MRNGLISGDDTHRDARAAESIWKRLAKHTKGSAASVISGNASTQAKAGVEDNAREYELATITTATVLEDFFDTQMEQMDGRHTPKRDTHKDFAIIISQYLERYFRQLDVAAIENKSFQASINLTVASAALRAMTSYYSAD